MMSAGDESVTSLYCDRGRQIVPLDGDFCRACSSEAHTGDGAHHEVTPEVLKREGYASTPVPDTQAQRGWAAGHRPHTH